MRIGIGSWTLPWAIGFQKNPYDYPLMRPQELIDYAVEKEIHLVQLYNNIDLLSFKTSYLKQIRKHADDHQIELAIGGTGIESAYLQDLLRIADLLSSSTVRTIIAPPKATGGRHEVEDVIEILAGCIAAFKNAGRVLLIENHDRYSSTEYGSIIDAVNSDALGICFDSANSIGKVEHFRDSFSQLKDFIISCHFKEYSIERIDTKLGFMIEGCRPGAGENIAEEFLGLMASLDKEIDVVLEQWVPYQGTVQDTLRIEKEWADEGIRLLKAFSSK